MAYKYAYINNTTADTSMFHPVVMAAIAAGGVFTDNYSDIFKLTKTPPGAAAEYILEMV